MNSAIFKGVQHMETLSQLHKQRTFLEARKWRKNKLAKDSNNGPATMEHQYLNVLRKALAE